MIYSKQILSINLKYYRLKYKLSQEKLAEVVGSSLAYIGQMEKGKRNPSMDMLDKIANGMNNNLKPCPDITSSDLIKYDKNHLTSFSRVDEKK